MPSVIHVFDKDDFSKHRLVELPSTPIKSLGESSLRLKTRIIGQTTNNLTYAKLGFAMGWWDIYPLSEHTPAPYNDRSRYATIAGWGYAEVLESTIPMVPAGASVYGYVRIGTGSWDVQVEESECHGQLFVKDEHRQHVLKVYNRLTLRSSLTEEHGSAADGRGWDALMEVLFGTGYNLSTYGFAWEDANRIHPAGQGSWSSEDADLRDSLIIILNAGGKTGLSFAYALRQNRPQEHQPAKLVAVGSNKSRPLLKRCGFYDEVLLNEDSEKVEELAEELSPRRVLLFDFGARPGTMASYTSSLNSLKSPIPVTRFFVGGDNRPAKAEDAIRELGGRGEGIQVNANSLREKGMEVGGDSYLQEFDKVWTGFKQGSAEKVMKLVWGEGMEGWANGWEAFCSDNVRADEGRIYRI